MANFLELDIQKFADFATSPDDYVLSYHTAKGLIDSREWIFDKETGLYKASYVFSIEDDSLADYGYSNYTKPHFKGWQINGKYYTVWELSKLRLRTDDLAMQKMTTANAWVVDLAEDHSILNTTFGNDLIENIAISGYTIDAAVFNGEVVWSSKGLQLFKITDRIEGITNTYLMNYGSTWSEWLDSNYNTMLNGYFGSITDGESITYYGIIFDKISDTEAYMIYLGDTADCINDAITPGQNYSSSYYHINIK